MKQVKFMLMSLALLTFVGAALAFKAKFHEEYCISALPADAGVTCADVVCPIHVFNSATGGGEFACTTQYDGDDCRHVDCNEAGVITAN